MSSSNNPIFATLCLLFSLSACSNPQAVIVQGEPDHSIDSWIPQDAAQTLCRYSRGAFPNWTLWPAFEDYLLPDEKSAILEINHRLIAQVPPSKRPKYIAVRLFIARNTQCYPVLHNGITAVQKDALGNIGFEFDQVTPIIPNIPDIPVSNTLPFDEQVEAWVRAFQNAWKGNTFNHKIQIVLAPDNQGQYRLRSNVRNSYAAPLNELDFRRYLDDNRLEEAHEKLAIICAQDENLCHQLTPHAVAAAKYQQNISKRFADDVDFSIKGMTNIATTANTSYTAIELELKSKTTAFSHIVFRTDEITPQYCSLQSVRTHRDDSPLTLTPGQTVKAWCALNGNTRPWTHIAFWIADAH